MDIHSPHPASGRHGSGRVDPPHSSRPAVAGGAGWVRGAPSSRAVVPRSVAKGEPARDDPRCTVRARRRGVRVILAAGLALLAAACSQPEVPIDRFYRLAVPPPTPRFDRPPLAGTPEVPRFFADGLAGGRPIAYVDREDGALLEYRYHHWNDPPPILIRDQLIDYLRAANAATRVVVPELRVQLDHVLVGRLIRFEHVRSAPEKAVVVLEIGIRRADSADLVHLATYRAEAPFAGGIDAVPAAMSRALSEVFARFLADLAKA